MYIPKHFRCNDELEVLTFIQSNSFGILVATGSEYPVAAHLPFLVAREDGQVTLSCHVAYANPIWRIILKDPVTLTIFQGPHAYVSSSWYNHTNVPTWNYMAAHVYGAARVMEEGELKASLQSLLGEYEGEREKGVLWDTLPEEYLNVEIKKVVGISIAVEKIECAYKLSQNRDIEDYQSILHELGSSSLGSDREMSAVMGNRCPHKDPD